LYERSRIFVNWRLFGQYTTDGRTRLRVNTAWTVVNVYYRRVFIGVRNGRLLAQARPVRDGIPNAIVSPGHQHKIVNDFVREGLLKASEHSSRRVSRSVETNWRLLPVFEFIRQTRTTNWTFRNWSRNSISHLTTIACCICPFHAEILVRIQIFNGADREHVFSNGNDHTVAAYSTNVQTSDSIKF